MGLSGAAGVGLGKELTDWHNGSDTFPRALFHFITILAGSGVTAAFYH